MLLVQKKCAEELCPKCLLVLWMTKHKTHTCPTDKITCLGRVGTVFFYSPVQSTVILQFTLTLAPAFSSSSAQSCLSPRTLYTCQGYTVI